MAVNSDVLISTQRVPSASAAGYTSVNRKSIVDMFTVTNTTAAAVTFSAWVVPEGGAADDTTLIIDAKSIDAHDCWVAEGLVGRRLNAGESIYTEASAATSLTMRAEGRTIT